MDRDGLADFLRRRREGLIPADVGLAPGVRRRTAGLRREEVAQLAGMSIDYYTRLEQRRGPHPSAPVLASLARALRLTEDERDHLFHLADQPAPRRRPDATHVSPGLLHVLDLLDDSPAFVSTELGEVLAQNQMSKILAGDKSGGTPDERNSIWQWFTNPAGQQMFLPEDRDRNSRTYVADLRATAARRAGDSEVEAFVARLVAASPEFALLWAEHQVAVRRATHKRQVHPEVGLLEFLCEVLTGEVGGQRVVILVPEPGTDCREKLDLLRVIGTQQLTPTA